MREMLFRDVAAEVVDSPTNIQDYIEESSPEAFYTMSGIAVTPGSAYLKEPEKSTGCARKMD